ncbi:DUF2695 domain-containing protein [Bacillus mycoides]|uniref:DUF2695 domain-containing protein n=1 Tax=Bacillus TaxID=1386 RepID=UPI0002798F60|nr:MULTISPECIES: DUF2695 domain-containing protein [Bacillus]EJS05244.1 hypothetical protein IKO_02788 [Bacillus cereus VDM034]EJS14727.1 hypothetical protein IKS_02323 [Bacillus cereus VDM062]MBG9688985.1 hypothetical protein [Bacillus mycoides]PRD10579.1 DUF2695 domain-containing protein [Bacillus sp. MYb56]QWG34485.1 DUF2695 domain-containing protein [Bacillus mycoides]
MNNLEELQKELIEGQKLAMQGSYERKEPNKRAVPYFLNAKKGLYEYIKCNPDNSLAWRLLSQCEECLLNYHAAVFNLQKAIQAGGGSKKDLKKLALLKEYRDGAEKLNLSTEQLESLEAHLEESMKSYGCDHSLKHTKEWLVYHVSKAKSRDVIRAMRNRGGFCDCEVIMNVIN